MSFAPSKIFSYPTLPPPHVDVGAITGADESQNYQYFFWKLMYVSWSKLSKELKNGFTILVGQAVFKVSYGWKRSKYCLDQ